MRTLTLLLLALLFVACGEPTTPSKETDVNSDTGTIAVTDSFTYDPITLRDSVFAPGTWEDGAPMAEFEMSALRLTNGSAEFRAMVEDSLSLAWTGKTGQNGEQDWAAYIDRAKVNYLTEIDSLPAEEREYASVFRRSESLYVETLVNRPELLVLAANHYAYLGGAHGMYYTEYYNFTDTPARALSLDDLVHSGEARTIVRDLVNEFVDRDRLYESDDSVALTNNVAITEEGLLFTYPPYEIGPYAAGQIEVTVPYEELMETGVLTETAEEIAGILGR